MFVQRAKRREPGFPGYAGGRAVRGPLDHGVTFICGVRGHAGDQT